MLDRLAPMVHNRSILVAHPPPRGTLDRVMGRFHAGSLRMARLVCKTAPAVMICGHIHESAGIDRIGATLVVNCALGSGRRGVSILVADGQPPEAALL
jgi:Icc-related predicted phosphoesterase